MDSILRIIKTEWVYIYQFTNVNYSNHVDYLTSLVLRTVTQHQTFLDYFCFGCDCTNAREL